MHGCGADIPAESNMSPMLLCLVDHQLLALLDGHLSIAGLPHLLTCLKRLVSGPPALCANHVT
jgi:hypothetical protein